MAKKNHPPVEPVNLVSIEDSDNVAENEKYIRKLALQRSVLQKIAGVDLHMSATEGVHKKSPDSDKP